MNFLLLFTNFFCFAVNKICYPDLECVDGNDYWSGFHMVVQNEEHKTKKLKKKKKKPTMEMTIRILYN